MADGVGARLLDGANETADHCLVLVEEMPREVGTLLLRIQDRLAAGNARRRPLDRYNRETVIARLREFNIDVVCPAF